MITGVLPFVVCARFVEPRNFLLLLIILPFRWHVYALFRTKKKRMVFHRHDVLLLIRSSASEVETVVTISEQTATDPGCNRGLIDSAIAWAKKPVICTEGTST